MRIAFFLGAFPVVSETFILRQITGLVDLGHQVHIFADLRADSSAPLHPEVEKYQLLSRTTFMDLPPEMAPWELPIWPLSGQTWLPGSDRPIANWRRFARALPTLVRSCLRAPRLTRQALQHTQFGYQAQSLSALHRL